MNSWSLSDKSVSQSVIAVAAVDTEDKERVPVPDQTVSPSSSTQETIEDREPPQHEHFEIENERIQQEVCIAYSKALIIHCRQRWVLLTTLKLLWSTGIKLCGFACKFILFYCNFKRLNYKSLVVPSHAYRMN